MLALARVVIGVFMSDQCRSNQARFPFWTKLLRWAFGFILDISGDNPGNLRGVLAAIEDYYLRDNANVHHGVHTLAERATAAYEAARERVRSFYQRSLAEKSS